MFGLLKSYSDNKTCFEKKFVIRRFPFKDKPNMFTDVQYNCIEMSEFYFYDLSAWRTYQKNVQKQA